MTRPDGHLWVKGMNDEMGEMIDRGVFVMPEPGEELGRAFGSKIVYEKKRKFTEELGEHIKYKARCVAKGYSSIFGEHYDETYSPTVLFKSLLLILTIAQLNGWYKTSIDIGNAYLEAVNKRQLCMWLPLDWTGGKKIKVKLARNLYGLKDAGLMWYLLVIKVLKDMGYERSKFDPCIFYKVCDGVTVSIIAVFVDDMALTGDDKEAVLCVKAKCGEIFKKITDMGELVKFLGIEFEHDTESEHLVLTQLAATNEYIEEHLKHGSLIKNVPIAPFHQLDTKTAEDEDESKHQPIWDVVGKIRYLADHSRPEMLYVASKLGTKQASAPPKYQKVVQDALAYLKATKGMGLRIGGKDKVIKLFAYADASFIAGDDSKSQLAYCVFVTRDSGAICCKSMKDKTVSLSSTEAEIKALVECIKEILWFRAFLAELGYPQNEATVIYQDNTSSIALATKLGSEGRTRHILNRINFIREVVESGAIRLEHIRSEDMVADVLTGPRERSVFEYLRDILLGGHMRGGRRSVEK